MTSLVRRTISYDTVSAASPVMNVTGIVLECASLPVRVRVRVRESDAASDLICLFASVCERGNSLRVSACVRVVQCLIVCDHALGPAGTSQRQTGR